MTYEERRMQLRKSLREAEEFLDRYDMALTAINKLETENSRLRGEIQKLERKLAHA